MTVLDSAARLGAGGPGPSAPGTPADVRRSWKAPFGYGVGGLVVLALAALPAAGSRTLFTVSSAEDVVQVPDFSVPARPTVLLLGVVALALAAYAAWAARERRRVGVWLPAVYGAVALFALLTASVAGKATTMSITSLFQGALFYAIPLVFGALAGLLCERSGIVNIAIEGQLLAGAFLGAVVASLTGSAYLGLVAAPVAGALVALLLVLFSIRYLVDQIIVGVVLNVLVVGVTNYLFSTVLTKDAATWNTRHPLPSFDVPLLSEIPVVGPVLFRQNLLVYIMYVVVIVLQVLVFRSRWGLRLRAVGEHPKAADTVGIDVNRTRRRSTVLGGAMAGLGGAFFTLGVGLAFGKEMTGGRGYIALAAMILGRWSPRGAMAAALLFGLAENLRIVLSISGSAIPTEFLQMLPYLATIFAVAGLVGRVRAPAAEGTPYVK